jgi:chromosomal replication initiation ATPase DnaA
MTVAEKKEIVLIKNQLNTILEKINSFEVQRPMPQLILKKDDRIRYVMDTICDYYGVNQATLVKRYRDSHYALRKKLTIKLLRDIADITYQDVGDALGMTQEASQISYTEINEILQEDTYGNKELKQEYKTLLKYLLRI